MIAAVNKSPPIACLGGGGMAGCVLPCGIVQNGNPLHATRCGIRIFSLTRSCSRNGGRQCVELREQVSKERGPKKLLPLIQNLRPRVCYVLSLLRIHSPDCEHCMARLTCGDELRKRLEQLSGRRPPRSRETGDDGEAAANRTGTR
jgi:hypothetical protein